MPDATPAERSLSHRSRQCRPSTTPGSRHARLGSVKASWPYPGPSRRDYPGAPEDIAVTPDGAGVLITDKEIGTNEYSPAGAPEGGFQDDLHDPIGVAVWQHSLDKPVHVIYTAETAGVRRYETRNNTYFLSLPKSDQPLYLGVDEVGYVTALAADPDGYLLYSYDWRDPMSFPKRIHEWATVAFAKGADVSAMAVTPQDEVFVPSADPGWVTAIDNLSGRVLGTWSAPTGGLIGGSSNAVFGAAVDRKGNLYVSNADTDPSCSGPLSSCPPAQIIRYTLRPRVSMQLTGGSMLRATPDGRVRIPVSCQARRRPRCLTRIALRLGERTLASRRVRRRTGHRSVVSLRLADATRRRLARRRALRVHVVTRTKDGPRQRRERRRYLLASAR